LFQTARMITCGRYTQIAIHDYLRCVMMMHTKDTAWTIDPCRDYNGILDEETVSHGQGNTLSVKCNLLYRFHSVLSKRDAIRSTDPFKFFLSGKPDGNGGTITDKQIEEGEITVPLMGKIFEAMNANFKAEAASRSDPKSFFPIGFDQVRGDGGYVFKRNADGYFDDTQMVAELVRCMEDPMYSFGSRQITKVFQVD
jgi:hypothetical protein